MMLGEVATQCCKFRWLPSADAALVRVARRVREVGHGIPDDVVARRYAAGLGNMCRLSVPLVDAAFIYDDPGTGRVLIAKRECIATVSRSGRDAGI